MLGLVFAAGHAPAVAERCPHDALVDVLGGEQLLALDAVLFGVQFKVDIVEHTHRFPIIHLFRIVGLGIPAQNARHHLSVMEMEGVLIVLFSEFPVLQQGWGYKT